MMTMIASKLLAAVCDPVIGCITPPANIDPEGISSGGKLTGIMTLLNNLLKLIFLVAGIYALLNIIIAGYSYMNAGGDPKNLTKAWDRIWQSLLGLLIIVCSFIVAAIMGILLFNNPLALLQPTL